MAETILELYDGDRLLHKSTITGIPEIGDESNIFFGPTPDDMKGPILEGCAVFYLDQIDGLESASEISQPLTALIKYPDHQPEKFGCHVFGARALTNHGYAVALEMTSPMTPA